MAYSYIEIPTMPVWNSLDHPYLVILMNYDVGADKWDELYAYYSSSPFTYSPTDNKLVCNTETVGCQIYDGSAWSSPSGIEFWESSVWPLSLGLTGGSYYRVWTNHDIYDEEYNLFLAENSVNPIGWSGLKNWLTGLAIGVTIK